MPPGTGLDNTYENEYRQLLEFASQKDWVYNTDISDQHAIDSVSLLTQSNSDILNNCFYEN